MGIRGLTTYIDEYYSDRLRNVRPTGPLVIDALSLCYTIYGGIDWLHGGQYWELRKRFKYLFTSLIRSGIRPIVVFDGVDFTGNKSPVIQSRMEDSERSINESLVSMVSTDGGIARSKGGVIPKFAEKVFIETLRELGITLLYADGDADGDCAAIANYYKCPVVSNDSDYYMFNLEFGYISFDKFYWRNRPITAKLYKLADFVAHFRFRDSKLPLLIPAIYGNDYIDREIVHSLKKDIPALGKGHEVSNIEKTTRLIRYLSRFESIESFKEYINKDWDKDDCETIIDNYDIAEEIYIVEPKSIDEFMSETDLETANETPLPQWLLRQYKEGCFSSSAMMVLVANGISLSPIIDNPKSDESSLLVSRGLRSCLYRIMAPYLEEDFVPESIMMGGDWITEDVQLADESLYRLPSIVDIESLPRPVRIEALCNAMECSKSILDQFEDKWKLPVLSLCYWISKARPSMDSIKSLLTCHLVCSRDKDPLLCMPVQEPARLHRYWLDILHKFSMWQSIYRDTMKLNDVLMRPLPFQTPALLFDGKLVMYLATTKCYDRILEKASPLERQLYETLMSIVHLHIPTKHQSKPQKKKRSGGATSKATTSTGRRPTTKPPVPSIAVTNRFSGLTIDDSDSEQEEEED